MKILNNNKYKFNFDLLENGIQKEIILINTTYYQQIIANLIIDIDYLNYQYIKKVTELRILCNSYGIIANLINNNEEYTRSIIKNKYRALMKARKPQILNIRNEINYILNSIDYRLDVLNENKKQYYYYYILYKKL